MSPSNAHTLSGAYACDALGSAERLAFEDHLRHCTCCADEVAEFYGVLAVLGGSVPVPAPEGLWLGAREAIASVRQEPPAGQRTSPSWGPLSRWTRRAALRRADARPVPTGPSPEAQPGDPAGGG